MERCFFFPELCRGWESVYSFISGEALSLKILPIIAVIKVNKQLIDSSCFQFPPFIFWGWMEAVLLENVLKQFIYTGSHGTKTKTGPQKMISRRKCSQRCNCFVLPCCDFFRFLIPMHCVELINGAQFFLLRIVFALHGLTQPRETFYLVC